jgi:beta-glucosidase-like glycosyl hydrolase
MFDHSELVGDAEGISKLVSQMTLEEKTAQLCSTWAALSVDSGSFAPLEVFRNRNTSAEQDCIDGIGQLTRPFGSRPIDPVEGAIQLNEFQNWLRENTRLGIPAIAHEESLSGFMTLSATQFPSPLNYGSTWNPELIQQVGDVIRSQMRQVGTHQALAPVADVIRDARWGRVEECMGEDPYLVGLMVTHYVLGLQGDSLNEGIIATLKHFAGYSGSEGGRNFAPNHTGMREMRDIFLLPFEMAVKLANARSVMNAYLDIDGVPCAASHLLLTDILRGEWGFDGIVVADYGAVDMLQSVHHVSENHAQSSAMALSAGLDVELPDVTVFPDGIADALDQGILDIDVVDTAVSRILALKFELGLFESQQVNTSAIHFNTPEDQQVARDVAIESMTLLKNDGMLPLSPGRKYAVIGPNAHDEMCLYGNYSYTNHVANRFDVPLPATETVFEAIQKYAGEDHTTYAAGCRIIDPDFKQQNTGIGREIPICRDESQIQSAIDVASAADVVIAVLGDKAGNFRTGTVGEGTDVENLELPGVQGKLLQQLIETNTPLVLVLVNGRPYNLAPFVDHVAAIVETWFPGQEGADVITRTLFGEFNPGGKTTVTFTTGAGVQPFSYNHKAIARGAPRSPLSEPVFPFGHGLSYTSFEYSDFKIGREDYSTQDTIGLNFRLQNQGKVDGDEVVQLYIRDQAATVTRPVQELKAFKRIMLQAGQSCQVTIELPTDMLSFTGLDFRRIVEPGDFLLMLGSSSKDIRFESVINLTGDVHFCTEDRALVSEVRVEYA